MVMTAALLLDPRDNLGVALRPLSAGEHVILGDQTYCLAEPIPSKHKFALEALSPGQHARLYGVRVGIATQSIPVGGLISTENLLHDTEPYRLDRRPQAPAPWQPPEIGRWRDRSFDGYHRSDGSVGTANHWLIVPMVFCENRNVQALRTAFERGLGYERSSHFQRLVARLLDCWKAGGQREDLLALSLEAEESPPPRPFANLDGIQFLTHNMGCGGTRDDAATLCGLLAGYITHPNVAGATVLALGCEHAQVEMLEAAIQERCPGFDRPLLVYRQQAWPDERRLLSAAIRETFLGLIEANQAKRQPAPLSRLCIGVECGGSDGFSGISANPAVGALADRVVALGGSIVMGEFPELCGVEQDLINRCVTDEVAARYVALTEAYAARAQAVGSDFSQNPSPGNIRDGLITDAIKSAGAAKKAGSSPPVGALDYPEVVKQPGLHLLCTPGGDAECTTALAGAHANLILFTTGLGTPMGNPVSPVVKISSHSGLAERLPDLIDFDTGPILRGEWSIEACGEALLDYVIEVASGRQRTKAEQLGQADFQPWKRGVSL